VNKILFLVAHRPGRSPGQRFRFEQYLDHLRKNGFVCDVSWLLSQKDDAYFYLKRAYFHKFLILLKTLRIRLRDLQRAEKYDIIFIYREAVMYGSTWFERRLRKKKAKLVLDYDDAIWLKDVSEGNRDLGWLKRPSKTADIIRLCDIVITGNNYLAGFARKYNSNVVVIPTTIDTSTYCASSPRKGTGTVCIGWTGSTTTLGHLELAAPFLKRIYERFADQVRFRVIADRPWEQNDLPVEFVCWSRESEIADLAAIDIGIMPLPDNEWAKGKCGFKGLQYMALGIPAVLSAVGVNNEIIENGKNGFLVATEDEWVEKLSLLIENEELRKRIGESGRKTVLEHYSFEAWKNQYAEIFKGLLQ
jgi:glycosyltransferase involved in cell wall biosynthesis